MKFNYSIGKWFGVNVSLNISVFVLFYLIFSNFFSIYTSKGYNVTLSLVASILCGVIFLASILAHEFGHILIGRRFGIEFNTVILHMLGGAAMMNNNVPNPKSEALMAVAGPAVSMMLSLLFGMVGLSCIVLNINIAAHMFLSTAYINFMLGAFNVAVLMYPMDGFRIVRAFAWHLTKNFIKATRFAIFVGKIFSSVFILCGILMICGANIPVLGTGFVSGLWIIVIGALTMLMGNQELKQYDKV